MLDLLAFIILTCIFGPIICGVLFFAALYVLYALYAIYLFFLLLIALIADPFFKKSPKVFLQNADK